MALLVVFPPRFVCVCVCPEFAANEGLINHLSLRCFDVMHDWGAHVWVFYFENKKKSLRSFLPVAASDILPGSISSVQMTH